MLGSHPWPLLCFGSLSRRVGRYTLTGWTSQSWVCMTCAVRSPSFHRYDIGVSSLGKARPVKCTKEYNKISSL